MNTIINMKHRRNPHPAEGLLVETTNWTAHNHMCSKGKALYEVFYMGNLLGTAQREWDYFGRGWDVLEVEWS